MMNNLNELVQHWKAYTQRKIEKNDKGENDAQN